MSATIALCVPPASDGHVDDATLCAAAVAGVDEVYRIGGAQAVGALAYGTESVPAVDVIAGPGNAYVAEAKRQLSGVVGVASAFAGPSEIVVVAGPDATPEFAAIDLVVQAEHGPDGLAWLVTWDAGSSTRCRPRSTASSPPRLGAPTSSPPSPPPASPASSTVRRKRSPSPTPWRPSTCSSWCPARKRRCSIWFRAPAPCSSAVVAGQHG